MSKVQKEDLKPLSALRVEIARGDVTNEPSLENAFQGVETVFHLAGIITIMPRMKTILEKVNIEGVRNVVTACRKTGVRHLVYTSSIHAIEEPPHGVTINESQPFNPEKVLGDYAWSKARASLFLLEESKKSGLDITLCCPTGVIGPYDYNISNIGQMILDFDSGHLKSFVAGAYDFVDVRDVASGLILAAEKGKNGRSYILSGDQVQIPELMQQLAKDIGKPAPTFQIPVLLARTAGVLASVYYRIVRRKPVFTAYSIDVLASNSAVCSTRAREELGFTSRTWRDSIHDQVEWFRDHRLISTPVNSP